MMTALLLCAYSAGIYSSQKIAGACIERMDFMAATAMEKPDFRTINDFRKRHLKALEGLFVQVLRLCGRAGLVKLSYVALDGTKGQANASKHKAMSYARMCSEEKRLADLVGDWMRKAAEVNDEEDDLFGADKSGDEMPVCMKSQASRLAKICEAKAELEKEAEEEKMAADEAKRQNSAECREFGEKRRFMRRTGVPDPMAQWNFTDPDSGILRAGGTYLQGYNCQAAVDGAAQTIVAKALAANQNDSKHLLPILNQVREKMGRQTEEISADAGYCTEENLREVSRRRIRGYIATGRQKHGAASPRDQRALKGRWTRAMATRLSRAGRRSRYRLRKHAVEPVFGQIKDCRGIRRFHLRGLDDVTREWGLICTAHNLGKLVRAI